MKPTAPTRNAFTCLPRALPWLIVWARFVGTLALLVMLAAILIPTAKDAWELRAPTPAQLLVAVCLHLSPVRGAR